MPEERLGVGECFTDGRLALSDECIHGFDDGLCAQCFPPLVTEPLTPTVKRVARVKPASLREAPVVKSTTRGAAPVTLKVEAAPTKVAELRIYHVTHVDNLASILASGQLFADFAKPPVNVSSAGVREARRAKTVDERVLSEDIGPRVVADYVPFYLSPNAHVWNSIRAGHDDPRLTLEALGYAPSEFVLLVSTVKHAFDAATQQAAAAVDTDPADAADGSLGGFAVADGDAVGLLTTFATTRAEAERMLKRLRADESDSILGAEVLVADTFPFEQISLIGVANDKVRATVRGMLAAAGHKPKVAVYPPWFQATEDIAE